MNEIFIEQLKIQRLGTATPAQLAEMQSIEEKLASKNAEYAKENDELLKEAKEHQATAARAAKAGDRYNKAEIFLQIGVVFCSITLLTKRRGFFYQGTVLALVGVVVGVTAFLM